MSKHPALEGSKWVRGLTMLLFWLILQIVLFVLGFAILLQFAFVLFGAKTERLQAFCGSLSTYVSQILRYLGFASDERPFPFADWPLAEDMAADAPRAAADAQTGDTDANADANADGDTDAADANTDTDTDTDANTDTDSGAKDKPN